MLLSASIGFSLLALRAGAQPKMMPTAAEKPTPSQIANVLSENVISVFMQIASDTPKPTTTPITPPSSERIIASIKNCT